jgi:hypothetical protein
MGGLIALVGTVYSFYKLREGIVYVEKFFNTLGVRLDGRINTFITLTNFMVNK